MKNKVMKIEDIYISENKNGIRLIADIKRDGQMFRTWFEYPREYKEYVCHEKCDAFIIAILPYAMQNKMDIISKIPISERLYYQIEKYYIPILSKYQKSFFNIKLVTNLDNTNYNVGNAVGTGCSCGVDSFYSILSHIDTVSEDFKLTHLVSMNVGSFGPYGGDVSRKWFFEELENANKVANDLNIPLITIDSNLMEFYEQNHAYSGTVRMMGAILGLQKLFSKYYISSGFDLKDFDITAEDNDDYDLFNTMVGSNESTLFYSSAQEVTRYERTQYITRFPVTYNTLTVCSFGNENCGKCEKCLRTIGTLYVQEELDKYQNIFKLEDFYKHKLYYLAKIRFYGIGYMHPLYDEIYMQLKKRRLSYFIITAYAVLLVAPYEKLTMLLKKIIPNNIKDQLKRYIKR